MSVKSPARATAVFDITEADLTKVSPRLLYVVWEDHEATNKTGWQSAKQLIAFADNPCHIHSVGYCYYEDKNLFILCPNICKDGSDGIGSMKILKKTVVEVVELVPKRKR